MGNQPSNEGRNRPLNAPQLDDYTCRLSTPQYHLWEHLYQRQSLIEIQLQIFDQQHAQKILQNFWLRHRHHLLVSNEYFQYADNGLTARIFYQRVFTNLSRIKDIPFIDSLQFYYVGLKGFQILYEKFGYFEICEQMFHLTDKKRVKIWLHHNLSKNQPSKSSRLGSQSDMVKKVIQIIDQNIDHSLNNDFPIGSILYKCSQNFKTAIVKLRDVCRSNNYIIPEKLKCLDCIYDGKIGNLLDQYAGSPLPKADINQSDYFGKNFKVSQAKQSFNIAVNPHSSIQMDKISNNNERASSKQIAKVPNYNLKGIMRSESNKQRNLSSNSQKRAKGIQLFNQNLSRSQIGISIQGKNKKIIRSQSMNNVRCLPPKIQSPIKNLNSSSRFQIKPQSGPIIHKNGRSIVIFENNSSTQKYNFPPLSTPPSSAQSFYPRPPIRPPSSHSYKNSQNEYKIILRSPPISNSHNSDQMVQNKSLQDFKTNKIDQDFKKVDSPLPPRQSPLQINNYLYPTTAYKKDFSQQNQKKQSYSEKIFVQKTYSSDLSPQKQNFQGFKIKQNSSEQKITSPNFNKSFEKKQKTFEEYVKNFKYEKRERQIQNKKKEGIKKSQLWKKTENQFHEKSIKQNKNEKLGFFKTNLYQMNTIVSHEGSDIIPDNSGRKLRQMSNEPVFPSVTDISDNYSFLVPENSSEKIWKEEESLVTKLDPNNIEISKYKEKKYEPKIDADIWRDVMELRKRKHEKVG